MFNPQSSSVLSNAMSTSPIFSIPDWSRQTRNRATLIRRRPSIPGPSGAPISTLRADQLDRVAAERLRGLELLCLLQDFLCHFFLPLICPSGAMPCYMQSARQSFNALVPPRKCREMRILWFPLGLISPYNHSNDRSKHWFTQHRWIFHQCRHCFRMSVSFSTRCSASLLAIRRPVLHKKRPPTFRPRPLFRIFNSEPPAPAKCQALSATLLRPRYFLRSGLVSSSFLPFFSFFVAIAFTSVLEITFVEHCFSTLHDLRHCCRLDPTFADGQSPRRNQFWHGILALTPGSLLKLPIASVQFPWSRWVFQRR